MDTFSFSSFVIRSFTQDAGLVVLLLVAIDVSAWILWVRLPKDLSLRKVALRHAVLLFVLLLFFALVSAARVSRLLAAPLVALAVPEDNATRCEAAPRVTVVLGGGIESPRIPSTDTIMRLDRAVAYLYESHSPSVQASERAVVLSGGMTVPAFGVAEATVMSSLFRSLGGTAFADEVVLEDESKTTYENALFLRPLLAKVLRRDDAAPVSIALVTSAEHMLRARLTFEKQGFALCAIVAQPREFRARTLFSFRSAANFAAVVNEYLGIFGYWLIGRL